MSKYDTYFLMKENEVPEYVRTKFPDYFAPDAKLEVREIGDGNLNYVFRVVDPVSGKMVVCRSADVTVRYEGGRGAENLRGDARIHRPEPDRERDPDSGG